MQISNVRRTRVTVLGIKVAEIEVKTEFGSPGKGPERGSLFRGSSQLSIDPDYLTPLLAESAGNLLGLVPSQIAFGNGQLIEVNGNVDADVACQSLKDINNLSKENATKVVLGLAAQTDLYRSESRELQGAYIRQIERAVEEHWPKDGQGA